MFLMRFKLAALAGGVVGAAVVAGFGPVVRYQAGQVAERYGAAVSIERIVPGWHGVLLQGIDVTVADVPCAQY